jgi:Fur family transcriptional regulator, peroxide stress response regulator
MTDALGQERLEAIIRGLRDGGHRITPQRLAILRAMVVEASHPSVEEVHRRIQREFPTTSLATVYKTVSLLKAAGEILELGFGDLGSRYDALRPYPHPHVICTRCGAIRDPEDLGIQPLVERMAQETGYAILTHRFDLFGLCPSCQKQTREQGGH